MLIKPMNRIFPKNENRSKISINCLLFLEWIMRLIDGELVQRIQVPHATAERVVALALI